MYSSNDNNSTTQPTYANISVAMALGTLGEAKVQVQVDGWLVGIAVPLLYLAPLSPQLAIWWRLLEDDPNWICQLKINV